MEKVGKVYKYDGTFGIIIDEEGPVYFQAKDLITKDIQKDDPVIFRKEEYEYNLKLAKFIEKLKN